MKRTFILLIITVLSLTFFSCQKGVEAPVGPTTDTAGVANGDGSIIGTWKFISIEAKTSSTNEVGSGSDIIKTVTTSDYVTENNTGTTTFSATTATSGNISYSVNSLAKVSMYENGALIDTFSSPFQSSVPPSSSSAPYKKIGADSLYFQAGFMNNTTQGTQPGGAKMKLEQNMLYLTQVVNQTTTQVVQGENATSIIAATIKMTFRRQ